jgi:hypothetical protein
LATGADILDSHRPIGAIAVWSVCGLRSSSSRSVRHCGSGILGRSSSLLSRKTGGRLSLDGKDGTSNIPSSSNRAICSDHGRNIETASQVAMRIRSVCGSIRWTWHDVTVIKIGLSAIEAASVFPSEQFILCSTAAGLNIRRVSPCNYLAQSRHCSCFAFPVRPPHSAALTRSFGRVLQYASRRTI